MFFECYKSVFRAWETPVYHYVAYLFICLVIVYLLARAYIKVKYPFWSIQPVMHVYDVYSWFFKRGVIRYELPAKNKFCDFKRVETRSFDKVTDPLVTDFVHMIQTHFLKNKGNTFSPRKNNIVPYFAGHGAPCYWSFYWEKEHLLLNVGAEVIDRNKLLGVISGRPLHVTIYRSGERAGFDVYYIDYLCVDKGHRSNGIAPTLIQTHEYNQSVLNTSIQVSLFKREGTLTGIVPLCVYDTYIFSMAGWCEPIAQNAAITVIPCGKENMKYLLPLFSRDNLYDIVVAPSVGNIMELVQTENIFIYMMIYEDEVIGAYFFKNPCVTIQQGDKALTCYASIYNSTASCIQHNKASRAQWSDHFVHCFKMALSAVLKKGGEDPYKHCIIENVGSNSLVVDNLLLKNNPIAVSPTAYFFYNFAYPTFNSKNVLILN
jgi:hypothetical protein